MNAETSTVQIARILEPLADLGYSGDEGYVVEVDGEWWASRPTLPEALAFAEEEFGAYGFRLDPFSDYWNRATWTAKGSV